ncbi:hypothetical protein [Paenibacillus alkalitolerans]|uniref:hypothetical protein n=1 Tax=Paenibacillus alkalitolerans TaxID=2799335 RepID=UPI0018F58862|nr:hypothetical protein [Paenibacillus alkalitolerans]
MIGTILWNIIAGLSGAALIFLLSFSGNPLSTAGFRAMYSFFILFAVTFAVRWLLYLAANGERKASGSEAQASAGERHEDTAAGGTIDLSTPDDDLQASFSALDPPKLASVNKLDPEHLAKAVRHMSEK